MPQVKGLKTLNTELPAKWLDFEMACWVGVHNGLYHHVFEELWSLGELLNRDPTWRRWWSQTSKAPELLVAFTVYWPDKARDVNGFMPSRVSRGRKTHFVRLHVDAARLDVLAKEDRHKLAVPLLGEALDWLIAELRLNPRPELTED